MNPPQPQARGGAKLKVLVPTRGTPSSLEACRVAANLLDPGSTQVRLLSVLSFELYPESFGPSPFSDAPDRRKRAAEAVREAVAPARQIFEESGHTVHLAHRFGFPPDEILLEIGRWAPDLIVMGRWWPRRARDQRSVGRVVKRVLTHSDIPMLLVLFAPNEGASRPGRDLSAPVKVLVATNGSPSAERASRLAADILGPRPADVIVLAVMGEEGSAAVAQRQSVELHDAVEGPRAAFELRGKSVEVRARFGEPAHEVTREIQASSPDLVVMGRWRGVSRGERWVLGTVFERVIRHAHQPILLAR